MMGLVQRGLLNLNTLSILLRCKQPPAEGGRGLRGSESRKATRPDRSDYSLI